jgi:hypothetical protein
MKKIITTQRISEQWRDVIATSPSIQETMFLRLKTTPKETCEPHKLGLPKIASHYNVLRVLTSHW